MPGSATDAREAAVRTAFAEQAQWCAAMGSTFTAELCGLLGARLDRRTEVGRRVLGWTGNPGGWADGLPLRLCGGLHAIVRRGDAPGLAACYPPNPMPQQSVLWAAIEEALERQGEALLPWLDNAPQTNEVGRSGALMAGLLVAADAFRKPIRLYELGASAGLNLVLDRYGYDLGGTVAGHASSPVQLRPEWEGPAAPSAKVEIIERAGVDLQPVDLVEHAERLAAYLWPDQRERIERLEKALKIAVFDRPNVVKGDAGAWLDATLVAGGDATAQVVMHSVAYQYFPSETQERVRRRIEAVGEAGGSLGWLRFEKEPGDHETALRLRLWPGGEDRLLAYCHPHGQRISWLGEDRAG